MKKIVIERTQSRRRTIWALLASTSLFFVLAMICRWFDWGGLSSAFVFGIPLLMIFLITYVVGGWMVVGAVRMSYSNSWFWEVEGKFDDILPAFGFAKKQ